ncbi:MAG: ammonia-forming cytochrome c nitrite reductase subunit c552 [Kofleriaceae bacterium]|nr:ammonia-forming cytochrome c nitrite reductase subunit c552 [Kofleriaceae bacterium]
MRPAAGSTIAAADYIGPDTCGECHPDQHAQWSRSLHRVMNQRAEQVDAVIGDFDNAVVRYAGGEARFARDGSAYTMTLARDGRTVRYRVTRTIGHRGLQEYVGVEEGGSGTEVRLPFGWWPKRAGWFPQPYFDPWFAKETDFDAYAPVREPWAERCPWCHSTYPFEQRIARANARDVGHGMEQFFIAAPGPDRLATETQVTVGISCESCHLGGRGHAKGAAIHLVPEGAAPRAGAPVPTTFTAERRDPAVVNTVCAQCHSGPSPRLPDGTALRNSSEALDLAASACTTARCIDCHDPHTGGSAEARAIAACTGCHPAFADPSHGGHAAASCLDCHMPRMVMGIDRVVRTHRISSPTNPAMLGVAAPNACNLCHVDRSIVWTVDELAHRYEVRLDPRGWNAYGDLELPVGEVWRTSKEPALRLVAADAYARSPLGKLALPALLEGLADPLPHLRAWTLFAVERVLDRRIPLTELDVRASAEVRARQLAKLRATLR